MRSATATRSMTAGQLASAALLGLSAAAAAQTPPLKGEYIIPAYPATSIEVRAITPVKVNPTGAHAFISATSSVSSSGPGRFAYLNTNGTPSSFGYASWIPTGASGWFDVRSVDQQATTGNIVAAGRATGGGGSPGATLLMLLNSGLGLIAAREPGGTDANDLSIKALALPTGELVLMANKTPAAGKPTALIICWTANLSSSVWWHTFTTATCDELHFNDMKEFGGKLYLVGDMNPHSAAPRPFVMVVGADSAIPSDFGKPLSMWSYEISGGAGSTSRFTAVNVDGASPSTPVVWVGGENNYVASSFQYSTTRVLQIDGTTGAKVTDYEYGKAMTTMPGSIWHIPAGSCASNNYSERICLGGHRGGQVARHMRIELGFPTKATGSDFSPGKPPLAAFNAMVPASDPSYMLLGGRYRMDGLPGTLVDPYLVMTDCSGQTGCCTPWSVNGTPVTDLPVIESPMYHNYDVACDGSGNSFGFVYNPFIAQYIETINFTLNCPTCLVVDLDGDDEVGGADLAIVLGSWGACQDGPCNADLTGDGMVNGADLAAVLGDWGTTCPR